MDTAAIKEQAAIAATAVIEAAAKVQVEPPAPYTKREVKLAKDLLEHRINMEIDRLVNSFESETGARVTYLTYNTYASSSIPVDVSVRYNDEAVF